MRTHSSVGWICLVLGLCWGFPEQLRAGTFEVSSRAEMIDVMVRVRAHQFLNRATFGPTQAEVEALVADMKTMGVQRAAAAWIDNQWEIDSSSHADTALAMIADDNIAPDENGANITRYRNHAWWHIAIKGEDQLRQRVAWALSQIFVVSTDGANFNNQAADQQGDYFWMGLGRYYDMLAENADDTFRETLGDVTFSPIMGTYLSHLRNRKGDPARGIFPDENYAREVMQLFSIGLYEQNQNGSYKLDAEGERIPTYDNETIKAFARLFTGFGFANRDRIWQGPSDLTNPMKVHDDEHDDDPKTLLNGVTLPAVANEPGNAFDDINAGLDNLANHPNVAPFISRLLIQRLVRSNPSGGYISRVSRVFRDNGEGVRGDFKAVVKAILLDRECWDSIRVTRKRSPMSVVVRSTGTERNRLSEPVVMYAGLNRRFGSSEYPTGRFMLPSATYHLFQAAYHSPSVFNFYLPDYQPAGPIASATPSRRNPKGLLFAPEFQLYSSIAMNRITNRLRGDAYNATIDWSLISDSNTVMAEDRKRCRINFDYSVEEGLADDPAALVKHLDMTLCAGTMSNRFRNQLETLVGNVETTSNNYQMERARGAIIATITSPDFLIVE